MKTNKRTKTPITPSRRRIIAIGRILTNIRQLLLLDPSDEVIALIEQHTALLNSLYRHHAQLSNSQSVDASPCEVQVEDIIPNPDHQEAAAPLCNVVEESNSPNPDNRNVETPLSNAENENSPERSVASHSDVIEINHPLTPHIPQTPPQPAKPVIRLPRKLKKQLSKLPENHPLRLRYAYFC